MKKIILTVVATMMMTISFAERQPDGSSESHQRQFQRRAYLGYFSKTVPAPRSDQRSYQKGCEADAQRAQRQAVQYLHAAAGSHTSKPLHPLRKG